MALLVENLEQRLLSRKEAAAKLSAGVSAIDGLCKAGHLDKRNYPHVGVRITGKSLVEFMLDEGIPIE